MKMGKRFGYSRDKRSDCVQVVVALVLTPEGFPVAYEVYPGNTRDTATLKEFMDRIEKQYGKFQRIWLMDRGIPTENTLEKMRSRGIDYLVGTPKGHLTRIEQAFKDLKGELSIRPIWHQLEKRIEAHIFVSFLAYCLHTSLRNLARERAAGLPSDAIPE